MGNNNTPVEILVMNGVNLDKIELREAEVYGGHSAGELKDHLLAELKDINQLSAGFQFKVEYYQTNSEHDFIEKIPIDECQFKGGVIINPGAWSHTSLAIADRIAMSKCRFIEVHLSSIHSRESYRRHSFLNEVCLGQVSGFGIYSYSAALGILAKLKREQTPCK